MTVVISLRALCGTTLLALSAPAFTTASTQDSTDLEGGVDATVSPGDDFFAYANGAWLKGTEIPSTQERWTARNEIDELTRRQIAKLIDDADAAPGGSLARKVADFRAAFANEAAIEAQGMAALEPLLNQMAHVHDKVALARLLGSEMRADVDPLNWGIYDSSHLFGLSVEGGLQGEKTNVAFLLQGGLGLPDRDHYVNSEPRLQTLRAKYQAYIARLLSLAGFDHAEPRAEAVMALETAIAQSHATPEESANEQNAGNLWKRANFTRRAPGLDWAAFFAAAGLSRQEAFVVWQPGAVKGSAALIASQPLQVWLDYLRFHALDRHADVLPRAFAEQAFALHGTEVLGLQQQSPRAQRATEATQQAMSAAIGRMYAERHFPAELKARVSTITANVIAAFRERVEAATWMSPASKTLALAKLRTLYFGVGYPEKWPDLSTLTVRPADAAGNVLRLSKWTYREALGRLGQPVDRREWWIAPQTVGAVLLFQQNAYNFPAALLQSPKFDPAASEAANYGAIGAIIGHEVSHYVDTLGADYDADGRKVHWWSAEDLARYESAAEPLVNQFSAYRPFADATVDGKLTRTENIADLAGLAAAFDAYRGALGSKATDKDYVRQQDRQFFIGFARSWRSKMTEGALRKQIATDSHAPERYRISTVRNLDAWYEAFDVKPGQRLYLEPAARVRIW